MSDAQQNPKEVNNNAVKKGNEKLQKILSDERAKAGREHKKALEEVKENIVSKYESEVARLQSELAQKSHKTEELTQGVVAYEALLQAENERLKAELGAQKGEARVAEALAGLSALTAAEQFVVLRGVSSLYDSKNTTLPRPVSVPKTSPQNPLDRLQSMIKGNR